VHAREPAAFEDAAAALGFEERKPQQHAHQRRQLECARDERLDDLIRRIGQDAAAAGGHLLLHEKVADEIQRKAVIADVAADHVVTVIL